MFTDFPKMTTPNKNGLLHVGDWIPSARNQVTIFMLTENIVHKRNIKLIRVRICIIKDSNNTMVIILIGRICSIHFNDDDYERDLKSELLKIPARKILKKDAVPSVNLPKPSFSAGPSTSGMKRARKMLVKKKKAVEYIYYNFISSYNY